MNLEPTLLHRLPSRPNSARNLPQTPRHNPHVLPLQAPLQLAHPLLQRPKQRLPRHRNPPANDHHFRIEHIHPRPNPTSQRLDRPFPHKLRLRITAPISLHHVMRTLKPPAAPRADRIIPNHHFQTPRHVHDIPFTIHIETNMPQMPRAPQMPAQEPPIHHRRPAHSGPQRQQHNIPPPLRPPQPNPPPPPPPTSPPHQQTKHRRTLR